MIAVLVKLDVIQAIDTWVFNNVKDVANGLQVLTAALGDEGITQQTVSVSFYLNQIFANSLLNILASILPTRFTQDIQCNL